MKPSIPRSTAKAAKSPAIAAIALAFAFAFAFSAQAPSLAWGAAPASARMAPAPGTARLAAATLPTVATGGAKGVSYGSATLTGSVNPRGSDTSYYFQYGLTKLYGGQTTIADAGAGAHTVSVSIALAGLQPLTVYHYRLVAVNAAGAVIGGDRTLLTKKVPLSLQVLAAPNPVTYGDSAVIEGTLSGTGNANTVVVLQAAAFPFTAGFSNFGNPEVTLANGSFSFPVVGLAATTRFRVVTATKASVVSPVAVESVAPRIATHVSGTRRPHFARISGTVAPAEDGMHVGIFRVTHGRNVLVAGAILRHRSATSSKFARVLRVRPGVYRVLVRVTSGAQVSAYGQPLLIR